MERSTQATVGLSLNNSFEGNSHRYPVTKIHADRITSLWPHRMCRDREKCEEKENLGKTIQHSKKRHLSILFTTNTQFHLHFIIIIG